MQTDDFTDMNPDELRRFFEEHNEKAYFLVDVRQPDEYRTRHIPGATLIPLGELQQRVFDLPSDRHLIFYCHSGGRSAAASDLAFQAEVTTEQVINLRGGMMGWDGYAVKDFPQIDIFDMGRSVPDLMMTAMDLEKGAYLFYQHLTERYAGQPFSDAVEKLSQAEEAHAALVYRFWSHKTDEAKPFPEIFEGLKGDILEGGESLKAVLERLDGLKGSLCINVLELALNIEYAAYDLYRTVAEKAEDAEIRDALFRIAQAEKGHLRMLGKAVETCR